MNQTANRDKLQASAQSLLNRFPLAAPIMGSALLIVGGATVFWWLNRATFTPGTLPVGANLIPQDALTVVTLNTDPQQWRQLRGFGTAKSQKALDQALVDLRDRLFYDNGLDYAKDIQPWVGQEVTIAQLSPQSELSDGSTDEVPSSLSPQPMMVVLPIGDPLRAKEVMAQPKSLTQRNWADRVYKDIKVREAQPIGKPNDNQIPPAPLQMAVLENRLVLVTNSARSMNLAIDTYRSNKSLAQTPGYAQALGQIQQPTRPFFTLYRNIPSSITTAATNFDKSLAKQNKDWIEQSQGWATVANLQSEGIEFRNVVWLKPDSKRKFAVNNNAKSMPGRLPGETIAMFSGSDWQQFWQDYSKDHVAYPIQLINPGLFQQQFQAEFGLDWDEDILKWAKGEFSLAMMPMPGENSTKTPVSITLMVQASDRRAAEVALKKLDEVAASKFRYKVEPGKFNNEDVINWQDPITGTTVMHGWTSNNTAFLTIGAAAAASFLPQPRSPLANDPGFRQTTTTLTGKEVKTPNGYFYVNLDRVLSQPQLPSLFAWLNPYRDWAEGVRSIGMNAMTTNERTMQFNMLLLLKKGEFPELLPVPSAAKPAQSTPDASSTPKPKPSASPRLN
jgi:hypothetical protein